VSAGVSAPVLALFVSATQSSTITPSKDSVEELIGLSIEELVEIEVVTPSVRPLPTREAPSTIRVFTRELIRARGYRSLADLLADVPELEVHFKSSVEWSQLFVARGIERQNKFIVLKDGIRIDALSGTPHSFGNNFSLVDAERVEVILGPVSAVYGPDAFAGMVQIITLSGDKVNGAELSAGYGRFDTHDYAFVAGTKIGPASVAVSGRYYSSDEPNLADAYPKDYAWYFDRYLKNGSVLRFEGAPPDQTRTIPIEEWSTPTRAYVVGAKLDVGDFHFGYTIHSDRFSPSISGDPSLNAYVRSAKWQYTIQSGYAQHTLALLDDSLRFHTALSANLYALDPATKYVNAFSDYGAWKWAEHLGFVVEERATWSPTEWLSLGAGLNFTTVSGVPKTSDLPRPFDPDQPAVVQNLPYKGSDIPTDFFHVRNENIGSYAELQLRPISEIHLTGGMRFDHHTRYGNSFTPRVGVVVTPFADTTVKLLYGEAFHAPPAYEAYQHFGAFVPVRDESGTIVGLRSPFFRLPNPDLRPERLRTFELGVAHFFDFGLGASADAWYTLLSDRFADATVFDTTFKDWPLDVATFPVNGPKGKTYGGTASLHGRWSIAGFALQPWISYTFIDGDLDGVELPFVSKHSLKGGVDAQWGELSLSLRVIGRISRADSLNNTNDDGTPVEIPGSAVVNAYVRYSDLLRVDGLSMDVWLDVRNLLDSRFYNVSIDSNALPGSPQDPLRFTLGLDFRI
jgi:outer membrane receptor protein involved in Fe transport